MRHHYVMTLLCYSIRHHLYGSALSPYVISAGPSNIKQGEVECSS